MHISFLFNSYRVYFSYVEIVLTNYQKNAHILFFQLFYLFSIAPYFNAHCLKVHEEDGRIADLQETSEAGCSSNVVNEASTSNPGAEITVKPTEGVISSYVDNEPFRITATVPANDSGN